MEKAIQELLSTLSRYSSDRIQRKDDFALLFGSADRNGVRDVFDALSFDAKFLTKSYAILQRTGPGSHDTEPMVREFTAAVERVRAACNKILEGTSGEEFAEFDRRYLALDSASLQELLTLCSDLSWYKNWTLDKRPEIPAHSNP
jgi:hypothetical protein